MICVSGFEELHVAFFIPFSWVSLCLLGSSWFILVHLHSFLFLFLFVPFCSFLFLCAAILLATFMPFSLQHVKSVCEAIAQSFPAKASCANDI